jgi:predicted DNA-binding WGR domain protein
LCIGLEARSTTHRCFRAYEIAVGTDLFGARLVEMSYGRIGTMGRAKVRSFSTRQEALAQVNACLRKRATAPRRIGVAYHVRRVVQCPEWRQPDREDRLGGWISATSHRVRHGILTIMPGAPLKET